MIASQKNIASAAKQYFSASGVGKIARRLLFAALLFAAAFEIQATSQWGANLHNGQYSIQAVSNKTGFYLNVVSDSSLSVTTDLSTAAKNIQNKFHPNPAAYTELGYFKFNSDGNIISTGALNFDHNGVASIGDLAAGDQIGFWLTDANGNVTYSLQSLNDSWTNVFTGRDTYDYNSVDKVWEKRVFTYTADGHVVLPVLFAVGDAAHGVPTGQPLPGVLAALAIGGAVLLGSCAVRKIRRC